MAKFNLFELQQVIKENRIILLFEGEFSQGILKNLVETLKEKLLMESSEITDKKYYAARKIYSIFIELAQNIQHYSSQKVEINEHKIGAGIIVIIEDNDYFKIISGNWIEKSGIIDVIKKCDFINSLDQDSLKKFYKEKLRGPRPENSMGAGLGLIQIAKQSQNKLKYNQYSVDYNNDFFVLEVNINKEKGD